MIARSGRGIWRKSISKQHPFMELWSSSIPFFLHMYGLTYTCFKIFQFFEYSNLIMFQATLSGEPSTIKFS